MKRIQMFENALMEMAYNFSSNEFARKLRSMGCPERLIGQYQSGFLNENCIQDGTKRMWIKEKPTPIGKKPTPIGKKKINIKNDHKTNEEVGIIRKFLKWIY